MVSSNTYIFVYVQSVMQAFMLKWDVTSSKRSIVFRPTPYCSQPKLPCWLRDHWDSTVHVHACDWKCQEILTYTFHKRYPFHGNANAMIAKVSTVHVQWCPTYLNIEYPNGNCFIHSSLCSHVWSHAAQLCDFVRKFWSQLCALDCI